MDVGYETIRRWADRFGTSYAKRPGPRWDYRWYLGELFVLIRGRRTYTWRAVHAEGAVPEILVQWRRDEKAATISSPTSSEPIGSLALPRARSKDVTVPTNSVMGVR